MDILARGELTPSSLAIGTGLSRSAPPKQHGAGRLRSPGDVLTQNAARASDQYQHEAGKLLKCNYLGISNLFRCDSAAMAQA